MKLFRLNILLCYFLISSCGLFAVGENYQKPATKMPKKWQESKNIDSIKIEQKLEMKKFDENQWWQNFDDPVLNKLINKAVRNSYDYQIAQSKLVEARANLTSATSDLFPKSNLKASGQRENSYFNFFNSGAKNPIVNFFSVGFDSSWEVDLFGANKRAQESAKALFEASQEARNNVLTTLIAEIAQNYTEFRLSQKQLVVKTQINQIYQDILNLTAEKQKAGILSEIEVSQIKIAMIDNKNEINALKARVTTFRYNLEILLGLKAGSLQKPLQKTAEIPLIKKNVIIDAPASLLNNRPDIKQAERELASAVALKGYALAQILPKVSLTNFLGFNNMKSGNVFNSSSQVFAVGASASMPALNFGGVIAGYKISKERQKQAFLNYKKKVNNAIIEVESALFNFLQEDQKLTASLEQLAINREILDLKSAKYKSGLNSNLDFLQSEIDLLKAEEKFFIASANFTSKTISLYKSLGGGWQIAK